MAETPEECQAQIIKGKRTKRQRPPSPSPLGLHMVSSSSSADCSGGYGHGYGYGYDRTVVASPTTSAGLTETSTEEEDQDMANCLILLAQGGGGSCSPVVQQKAVESLYLYQCKTCDRCFPSFQALGGHRASHKKPKNNVNSAEEHDQFRSTNSIQLSLQLSTIRQQPPATFTASSNNLVKPKVHECSVCGAEFSSGQALGGHMRRHRALTTTATTTAGTTTATSNTTPQLQGLIIKKERNVLELDLNLPAPEDDRHRAAVTVFSASPLVDCHY